MEINHSIQSISPSLVKIYNYRSFKYLLSLVESLFLNNYGIFLFSIKSSSWKVDSWIALYFFNKNTLVGFATSSLNGNSNAIQSN